MQIGNLLLQGGWMMYPIYFCSIVALTIFLYKFVELRKAKLRDIAWFDKVLEEAPNGNWDSLKNTLDTEPHPGSRVIAGMMHAVQVRPDLVLAEAERVGNLELQQVDKGLGLLSFLAQVAPLLGLLGTVIGMVDMFIGLQGAGQAGIVVADLAGGIWQALLTTAAGLAVAVPTLAAHGWLSGQSDDLRLQLSDMVQQFRINLPPSTTDKV